MENIEFLPKGKRLRVGLVGFGKTGRAVASVLLQDKTLDLVWVLRRSQKMEHRSVPEFLGIDSDEEGEIHWIGDIDCESLLASSPVDAIIDFSSEDGMDYYGEAAAEHGLTIVSAISQLPPARIAKMHEYAKTSRVLWSPNITLGINFMIVAAKTLQKIAPHADISILEEHFKAKPEISGTAKKISEALNVDPAEVKVIRAGGIIGVHEILFGFPFQTVRLKHESIAREAFGNGAKFALLELQKREIGFYNMEELVGSYFVNANVQYTNGTTTVAPRIKIRDRVKALKISINNKKRKK
ncbi:MAG: dihydrodipicolinate reductase C-terminal domain-containing protein [Candidatus Planktophila sp.]|mgnify:CR=1 FL=1|jgi:4-hydroxy-tetrahydrodipicolinate reductase